MDRTHCKLPLATAPSNNDFLDIKDAEMVQEAKLKNYSLIYYYYLSRHDKTQALNALLEEEKFLCNFAAVKEIVHTYLYFDDYDGALEYVNKCKIKVPCIRAFEYLIKIHLANKSGGCANNIVFELVKEGVIAEYDRRLVEVLIEFYKKNCKECLNICLKDKLETIQQIVISHHYDKLTYEEAKFLYKKMPNKGPFLKKMVQINPKISKKYYLKYADIYGIKKVDISRILSAKFKTWAAEIALFLGWLDESHKLSMEACMAPNLTCLNRKGKWVRKNKKIFRFDYVL